MDWWTKLCLFCQAEAYQAHDSELEPQSQWAEHWIQCRFWIKGWPKPRLVDLAGNPKATHQFDSESRNRIFKFNIYLSLRGHQKFKLSSLTFQVKKLTSIPNQIAKEQNPNVSKLNANWKGALNGQVAGRKRNTRALQAARPSILNQNADSWWILSPTYGFFCESGGIQAILEHRRFKLSNFSRSRGCTNGSNNSSSSSTGISNGGGGGSTTGVSSNDHNCRSRWEGGNGPKFMKITWVLPRMPVFAWI